MNNVFDLKRNTYKDFIYTFLFLLIFFPSVTFGLIDSEIFPYGILVFFLIAPVNFTVTFFISTLLLLLNIAIFDINQNYTIAIWSFLAFLNGISAAILYCSINEKNRELFFKSLRISYYVLLVVPVLQLIIPTELSESFFKFFVPRAKVDAPFLGGLSSIGVSSLSSEPSRAGIILVFVHAMVWHLRLISPQKRIPIEILIIIIVLFVNRSATGAAFYLIYLILNIRFINFLILVPILASFILIFDMELPFIEFESKGLTMLSEFSYLALDGNFGAILQKIMSYGGTRFHGTLVSLIELPVLGFGLGNWSEGSYFLLEKHPYLWENNYEFQNGLWGPKPVSYISALILEVGFFTFLLILLLILISIIVSNLEISVNKGMLLPIFSLLFLGDIGLPVIFLCLAVYMFKIKKIAKN
jgi:uncharacterized membrane protein